MNPVAGQFVASCSLPWLQIVPFLVEVGRQGLVPERQWINRSTPQHLAVATSNFKRSSFEVEAWASLTSLRHLEHLERTIRRA